MTPITTGFTADDLGRAVVAAVHAPSQHNSQPWRFRLRDGGIEVYADRARRLSDWAAYLACGAATFNIRLALAAAGIVPRVWLLPYPDEPDVVARLEPDRHRAAAPHEHALFAAVPLRHSNRAPFWPDPVPLDARWRLVEAARAEGAWVELVIGASAVSTLGELAHGAHRVLQRDPEQRAEVSRWTRHGPARDGVPAALGGPVVAPDDLLPTRHRAAGVVPLQTRPVDSPASDVAAATGPPAPGPRGGNSGPGWNPAPDRNDPHGGRGRRGGGGNGGPSWDAGRAGHSGLVEAEPLVAVIGTAGDRAADQITAGQALQRMLLTATDAQLTASMISQPIEVSGAREQLRRALGRFGVPQMVLRIGYGQPGHPTPRRSPTEVTDPAP
ncbi:nitroreductase family protein [Micromonospora sp. CPCC 205371]|nr:nitroreductase family protein [Micromonospora sp. CPCC 205371]